MSKVALKDGFPGSPVGPVRFRLLPFALAGLRESGKIDDCHSSRSSVMHSIARRRSLSPRVT